MEITIKEYAELHNMQDKTVHDAYKQGVQDEKERDLPNTIFDALVEYGNKSKTLLDYSKGKDLNWIHLKPTREGSEGVKHVEISFDDNFMEIRHIGIIED